jgi:hypothetical protein
MANAQAIMNELKQVMQTHGRGSPEYKQALDRAITAYGGKQGTAGPGGANAAQQMAQQLDAGTTPTGAGPSLTSPSMSPGVQGQPGMLNSLVESVGLNPDIAGQRADISAPVPGQKPPAPIQGGQNVGPPPGANTPMLQAQPPTPGQKPSVPQQNNMNAMAQLVQQLQGQGQGQGPQPQQDENFTLAGVPWRQMLMGLAAGQAGLGRSPQVHQVLGSAAAGMFQTQQNYQQQQAAQRQQEFENQLAYLEAMSGGDQSQFERLLDMSNMSPEEKQEAIRRKLMGESGSGGTRISYDENGNPIVQIGGPYSASMRPSTQGNIEQRQTDLESLQNRLQGIEQIYKPERQTYQDKAYFQYLRQKNKAGFELTPEERQYLVETTQMKRRAYENLNLYIQEITGAQMSQEEAKRLRRVMPDPGDGIFDGDSPVQFEANLNDALSRVRASLKRYRDLRERGLLPNDGQITEELTREYPLMQYQDVTDDLSAMSQEELLSEGKKLYQKAQDEGLTPDEYDRYQRIQKLRREKQNGG